MAKATKLPSGNWRVIATKTVNGKKIRKSFTSSSKREAEQNALAWQGIAYNSGTMTLKEAVSHYISMKKNLLSPATIRSYTVISRNHFQNLMGIRVDKITPAMMQLAINEMALESSAKTVRNAFSLMNTVIKSVVSGFDCSSVTLPSKIKKDLYIPDNETISALISASQGTPFYIPILLGAFGGLRRGEICALTKDDFTGNKVKISKDVVIDIDNNVIVKSPKTYSSYRTVELPPFVIEEIKKLEYKIYSASPHSLTKGFCDLLVRSNLPKFRFHDLRHYYISYLFDLNVPEKYIIAQVGHSSANITKRIYDHLAAQKQSQYADQIASAFQKDFVCTFVCT